MSTCSYLCAVILCPCLRGFWIHHWDGASVGVGLSLDTQVKVTSKMLKCFSFKIDPKWQVSNVVSDRLRSTTNRNWNSNDWRGLSGFGLCPGNTMPSITPSLAANVWALELLKCSVCQVTKFVFALKWGRIEESQEFLEAEKEKGKWTKAIFVIRNAVLLRAQQKRLLLVDWYRIMTAVQKERTSFWRSYLLLVCINSLLCDPNRMTKSRTTSCRVSSSAPTRRELSSSTKSPTLSRYGLERMLHKVASPSFRVWRYICATWMKRKGT